MADGEKIELFLVNGTADSLITAEVSNWNGKAIKIPRIEVQDCNRDDIKGAGVYFLFCRDEEANEDSCYIGESENVHERLKQHIYDYSTDKEKYFWSTAVIFLGSDLNKAFIRYLEDRLVEIAKDCKRYNVLTKNTYKNTALKESDRASMEKFIKYVQILINTLGYKVLEPKTGNAVIATIDEELLYLKSGAANAKGLITTEGFVLLSGAKINEKTAEKSLSKGAVALRKKYIESELVVDFITTDDIVFSSPSAAADFVFGYSVSGPAQWKNAVGVSLKELEANH